MLSRTVPTQYLTTVSIHRWQLDGYMSCCLLHSVGVCCTTMTAMAWWMCRAAHYTRWVYAVCAHGDIHLYETNCGSVLANRAIKTGKEMVDEQITKFAVSLTTTLKPRRKLYEIIKSCEFQIPLNCSWNFILWFAVDALSIFVGFRWFSLAFVVQWSPLCIQQHRCTFTHRCIYKRRLNFSHVLFDFHKCWHIFLYSHRYS